MDENNQTWVDWLLNQPYGKYFIKIDSNYLKSSYNYYGLRQKITNFKIAYEIIQGPDLTNKNLPKTWPDDAIKSAINLYGLLHSRYILTSIGLSKMHEKYIHNNFEKCPRLYCNGIKCLPYGSNDQLGVSHLQLFCPNCNDIYKSIDPDIKILDGAYFGSSWVHLFIQNYKDIVPETLPEKYVPRLFGFKLYGEVEDSSSSSGDVEEEEDI